ncbi:MAG TPA: hypothetical protein DC057_05785 [Spirochaetia bacterium]|nr:hypothetical protein [Spirochaetia bacterium]
MIYRILLLIFLFSFPSLHAKLFTIFPYGCYLLSFDKTLNSKVSEISDGKTFNKMHFAAGGKIFFDIRLCEIGLGGEYCFSRKIETYINLPNGNSVVTGWVSINDILAFVSIQKIFLKKKLFHFGPICDIGLDISNINQKSGSLITRKYLYNFSCFVGASFEFGKIINDKAGLGGKIDVGYDIPIDEFRIKAGMYTSVGGKSRK